MSPKTPSASKTIITEVMTPSDANFYGKVFGGRILALMDLCAYVTAGRYSGEVCVTASFDRVDFHEAIEVGEVVSFTGSITYVGHTSMEVTIEVYAENVIHGARRHTNTARVTMVAIKDNRPTEVPPLLCETRDEKIKFLEGRLRRENRTSLDRFQSEMAATIESDTDEHIDRLLSQSR